MNSRVCLTLLACVASASACGDDASTADTAPSDTSNPTDTSSADVASEVSSDTTSATEVSQPDASAPGAIACGNHVCGADERCCRSNLHEGEPAVARCTAATEACAGLQLDCDGSEDCSGGEICCFGPQDDHIVVACETSCSSETLGRKVCREDSDCAGNGEATDCRAGFAFGLDTCDTPCTEAPAPTAEDSFCTRAAREDYACAPCQAFAGLVQGCELGMQQLAACTDEYHALYDCRFATPGCLGCDWEYETLNRCAEGLPAGERVVDCDTWAPLRASCDAESEADVLLEYCAIVDISKRDCAPFLNDLIQCEIATGDCQTDCATEQSKYDFCYANH